MVSNQTEEGTVDVEGRVTEAAGAVSCRGSGEGVGGVVTEGCFPAQRKTT